MRSVASGAPRSLRGGTGERFRGDGRVPFTVHRARGWIALACWLPMGGASARPGFTAARLRIAGVAVGIRLATRSAANSAWRHGPRPSVPWARSSGPETYTLARRRANSIFKEARFAWRTGRGGATTRRGDFSNRGPTTRKVTRQVSAGRRGKSSGS